MIFRGCCKNISAALLAVTALGSAAMLPFKKKFAIAGLAACIPLALMSMYCACSGKGKEKDEESDIQPEAPEDNRTPAKSINSDRELIAGPVRKRILGPNEPRYL